MSKKPFDQKATNANKSQVSISSFIADDSAPSQEFIVVDDSLEQAQIKTATVVVQQLNNDLEKAAEIIENPVSVKQNLAGKEIYSAPLAHPQPAPLIEPQQGSSPFGEIQQPSASKQTDFIPINPAEPVQQNSIPISSPVQIQQANPVLPLMTINEPQYLVNLGESLILKDLTQLDAAPQPAEEEVQIAIPQDILPISPQVVDLIETPNTVNSNQNQFGQKDLADFDEISFIGDNPAMIPDQTFQALAHTIQSNIQILQNTAARFTTLNKNLNELLLTKTHLKRSFGCSNKCSICFSLLTEKRYKCLVCADFVICHNCEAKGLHSDPMIRFKGQTIPKEFELLRKIFPAIGTKDFKRNAIDVLLKEKYTHSKKEALLKESETMNELQFIDKLKQLQ